MRQSLALIAMLLSSVATATDIVGRASVIDGDTMEIRGVRVRLFGVDAVESAQHCYTNGEGWPCGRRAAFALADLVQQEAVRCVPKGTDRFGRTLAICFVGERDVNEWLVREGWAVAYRRYSTAYVAAETEARSAKRNIWDSVFVQPDVYRHRRKR